MSRQVPKIDDSRSVEPLQELVLCHHPATPDSQWTNLLGNVSCRSRAHLVVERDVIERVRNVLSTGQVSYLGTRKLHGCIAYGFKVSRY